MKKETIEYFCDITKQPHDKNNIATMYLEVGEVELEFHFSARGIQIMLEDVKGEKWTKELFEELIEKWVKLI